MGTNILYPVALTFEFGLLLENLTLFFNLSI